MLSAGSGAGLRLKPVQSCLEEGSEPWQKVVENVSSDIYQATCVPGSALDILHRFIPFHF